MSGREAKRNDQRLYYKFIVMYFQNLHKDLFEKVEDLYYEVREKNPNVKDLTKTAQFMAVAMPHIPVPRYYNNRNLRKNTTQQQQVEENTTQQQQVEENTTHQQQVEENTTLQQQQLEGPQMVLEIPLHTPSSLLQTPPTAPVPSQPPLFIPDNIYRDLLFELQRDPELLQILNDFPCGDDDDISDLVMNDMQHVEDDISPLETHLLNIF